MKIRCFKVGFKTVTFKPGRPVDIQGLWRDSDARTLRAAKIDCRKRFKDISPDAILMIGIIDLYGLGPWAHSVAGNKPGSQWTDYEEIRDFELVR